MRHATVLTCGTAALLGTIGFASNAGAQSQRQLEQQNKAIAEAQQQQERALAEAHEQQERAFAGAQEAQERALADQGRVQEELQLAREDLEEAARNVARLSMEYAEPFAREITAKWGTFGHRARLGLTPEDTELGVRVAGVTPNGAAAEAGIEVGDVIVEIDGAALADPRVTNRGKQSPSQLLFAQLGNVEPGATVSLKVARDGQEREVEVKTRERGQFYFDALPAMSAMPAMPNVFVFTNRWQDMQLATLTPELGAYFGAQEGLLVVRGPQSDALGLRDGDVILDIGGRKPTTPEHAIRILSSFEEGETLRINILRRQQRQTLEFVVPASD